MISEITVGKQSKISIEINKLFGFWKVLEQPVKGRVLCLCTGCNLIQKACLVGKLRAGDTKSCGCKQQNLATKAFLEKYGVDNPLKSAEIQDKGRVTMLKKYGAKYSGQSKELRAKQKKTCLEKYGSETNLNTKDFKEKTEKTSLEKYGTKHPTQNEQVKNKGIQTRLGLYGKRWYQQTEEYKRRSEKASIQKYGTTSPLLSPAANEKRVATNLERYGVENYIETKEFAGKASAAMIEKYGVESYAQSEQYKVEQRQHYRLMQGGLTVAELARQHDVNQATLNNVYNDYGEQAMLDYIDQNSGSRRIFSTEVAMIKLLKDDFVGLEKYDRTPKEFKTRYKPDFRLELNGKLLYLNIDGLYDHSEIGRSTKGKKTYHLDLIKTFTKGEQMIFQIREDELRDRPEIVRSIVLNYFGVHDAKYNARSCRIRKVEAKEADAFFDTNHLMGAYGAAKAYGLYFDDLLVCCITIRSNKKDNSIEIARFGSLLNASVRGGFSKLLNYVKELYKPSKIISFCDMRYSTGKSYEKLGFNLEKTTLGWRWTDKVATYNRLQCRANMDDRKLSQSAYANELGWYKIYDAGQVKYVMELEQGGKILQTSLTGKGKRFD